VSLPLAHLVSALERLAPLDLAESWDNVGLLVDPRAPGAELDVSRVLLTIDATPEVLEEAMAARAGCIVAYHPPLFEARRRYARKTEPLLFAAASVPFAVYSPHTALDAAKDGVNDWLARCVGEGEIEPLVTARAGSGRELKLVVFVPEEHADTLRDALSAAGAGVIGNYTRCSFNLKGEGTFFGDEATNPQVGEKGRLERVRELRIEMVCPERALPAVARALVQHHPYEEPAWEVYPLAAKPVVGAGRARRISLTTPRPLLELVAELKANLRLPHLRLATSAAHRSGSPIRSASVAAGAGAGAFESSGHSAELRSDLYVTGEMRHHDVLALLARGASVVLCEHSSSERGYLAHFRERLLKETDSAVSVAIARKDSEPLRVV
jgi:dinuclear metal center YbgI/SA1388 family protein